MGIGLPGWWGEHSRLICGKTDYASHPSVHRSSNHEDRFCYSMPTMLRFNPSANRRNGGLSRPDTGHDNSTWVRSIPVNALESNQISGSPGRNRAFLLSRQTTGTGIARSQSGWTLPPPWGGRVRREPLPRSRALPPLLHHRAEPGRLTVGFISLAISQARGRRRRQPRRRWPAHSPGGPGGSARFGCRFPRRR
jgi:hypothetical protein